VAANDLPYRQPGDPALGLALATYGRTLGQNIGVIILMLVLLLPGICGIAFSETLFAHVASWAALLVGLGANALVASQVVPNWRVRWTLYERGVARRRGAEFVRIDFTELRGVHILPAREGMLHLNDGRSLRLEGFAGSEQLADRIESAASRAMLPSFERTIAGGGEVVLGPIHITSADVKINGLTLPRGGLAVEELHVDVAVAGNTHRVWSISVRDGEPRTEVEVAAIPFPTAVRELLEAPRPGESPLKG
jgi:hypothetical protein